MKKVTNEWACSCGRALPLHCASCPRCGTPLPQKVRNSVFREVWKEERTFREAERVKLHSKRWIKVGKFMKRTHSFANFLTLASLLFLVISLIVFRKGETVESHVQFFKGTAEGFFHSISDFFKEFYSLIARCFSRLFQEEGIRFGNRVASALKFPFQVIFHLFLRLQETLRLIQNFFH